MKLKLDENFGRSAAELLRSEGHDVSTVAEQALTGSSDVSVIEAARSEGRCLVTMDLDFSNPVRFDPRHHHGIAVVRVPHQLTRETVLEGVRALARALRQGTVEGKLWVIDRGRLREYTPNEK